MSMPDYTFDLFSPAGFCVYSDRLEPFSQVFQLAARMTWPRECELFWCTVHTQESLTLVALINGKQVNPLKPYRELPAHLTAQEASGVALAWLRAKKAEVGGYPTRPSIDGSVEKGWRISTDDRGYGPSVTVATHWCLYSK